MTAAWLRIRETITGSEIFRVASVLLYAALLCHVGFAALIRHPLARTQTIAAITLLLLLLALAAWRLFQPPPAQLSGRAQLACGAEVLAALGAIALLTLQPSSPLPALMWLVASAGIFPLALSTGMGAATVAVITLSGWALSLAIGVPNRTALPGVFVILFAGLLSILLGHALRTSLAAERKLRAEHALLRAVLELNPSMIYVKDTQGRYVIGNSSFLARLGYDSEQALRGKTAPEVARMQRAQGLHPDSQDNAERMHQQDLQVVRSGEPLEEQEIQGLREGDNGHWYRTSKFPLRDHGGATSGVLAITRDVTESKLYESRLQHQALHDFLTGLPNQRYLLQHLENLMHGPQGGKTRLSMLYCDIDSFKHVNDIHGHDIGDACLLQVTQRMRDTLAQGDFLARFGGDEFIILTDATVAEAEAKAVSLLHVLARPMRIENSLIKLQACIGVAQLSAAHATPLELLRDADAAMHQAKERGRDRVALFDATLQRRTTRRTRMDAALRFALERGELALVYQPKVALADGRLKGFEQLMRWNSPEYGDISPEDFIPIAESSGQMVGIGMWALEQACRQMRDWQARYPAARELTLAVNVSMRQLLQATIHADVAALLARTKVDPASIELELTETSAMANPRQSVDTLGQLKQLGLRIALDDFGTGYSSLAHLRQLPIDVVKIDRAFVSGLGSGEDDAIVRLVLALAHTLELETVAEGIETAAQAQALHQLGCALGQGYLYSAPLAPQDAENWIIHIPHSPVP